MADAHKNFAYSTIATAPSPATSGTTLNVQTGEGALFPAAPFNATIWSTGTQPLYTGTAATTAEIVRVTSKGSGDDWTIQRTQEDSVTARTIVVGDQIAASITAKTLTDIENNYVNSWSPYLIQTGSGMASYASTAASSTGSLFVFPVSLQAPVKFNQIMVPVSLSYITSARTESVRNTYYSYFGIFSLNSSTLLTLMSSNSFSIEETLSQNGATNASLTWNYPTTTHTSGYGYGSFPAGNLTGTAQISSYVSASRIIGLQFGGEISLSGGAYWIGVLQRRSTGVQSTYGLSNAGIIGQVINPINMVGTVSGLLPLGVPAVDWQNKTTSNSAWYGRHLIGLLTQTAMPNFGGTKVPDNITISQLGAHAATTASILPSVTFVST